MRVDSRLALAAPPPPPRSRAGAARFSLGAEGAARPAPGGVNGPATSAGVHALVALQGEEEPARRRRRAVARGQEILSGLDALKAGLLAGRMSPAVLVELRARLNRREGGTGDPGLDTVVAMVELRAAVELAKLEQGAARAGGRRA